MNRDLVVIEAPGKLRTLYRIFDSIGLHADIVATIGHFLENPIDLKDLAVGFHDGQFVEYKRQPQRADAFAFLKDHLRRCTGRVLIATDNDHEGHVIAQDLVNLIAGMGVRQPVYRLIFNGLDVVSVKAGLQDLHPVDPSKATPGSARRIVDRLIGGCLSDFDRGLPVGRVQSGLLGLCAGGIAHSSIALAMPAADGGKPFKAVVPVFAGKSPADLIAELETSRISPAQVEKSESISLSSAMNFGDALFALNDSMGMSLEDGASLLQQLYEAGDITYPRTVSRGFTAAGVETIERLAKLKGLMAFKRNQVPQLLIGDAHAHESIRPLNEALLKRLDLGKPFKLHANLNDAAMSLIARRACETGIVVRRESPDLSSAPRWAQELSWTRESRRPVLPWPAATVSEVRTHAPERVLVEAMIETGIGRPSTWVSHASKFTSRSLVDDEFKLTVKGLAVLAHAPEALRHVVTSAAIEAMFEDEKSDVADLVESALLAAHGGDEQATLQLINRLENLADEYEEYRPQIRRSI